MLCLCATLTEASCICVFVYLCICVFVYLYLGNEGVVTVDVISFEKIFVWSKCEYSARIREASFAIWKYGNMEIWKYGFK